MIIYGLTLDHINSHLPSQVTRRSVITPKTVVFPRVERKKAYTLVAEAIRARILEGELKVGQRLPPEREMAQAFGVSRVVVREAVRECEFNGFLKIKKGAGGGIFVARDFDKPLAATVNNLLEGGALSLDHLFELRLMLEPPAAAKAASHAGRVDWAPLREVVARAESCLDDSEELRAANLEFHRRMVALAGNPLLSALCETVLSILVDSLKGRLSIETSQMVHGYHREIIRAMSEGRPDEARALTIKDLEQLHARYRAMGVEIPRGSGPARAGTGTRN